jgi:beta-phosphoglucomutase
MDALLLDYNGVVVDDERLHYAAFAEVLGEDGIALPEAEYDRDYLGLDDRAAFREAFRRAGRPWEPAAVQRLVARKAERYAARAARELVVVPGVAAFVRAAATHAAVAVVSGAIRPEVETGLAQAGIADVVAVVVTADEVHATKPDPAGFRLALSALARRRSGGRWRAVVIEDSLPGLAAGRAIGAGCVALTTSHAREVLAAADAVWESFVGRTPADLDALWRPVEVPDG